jgi:hypothetical protein
MFGLDFKKYVFLSFLSLSFFSCERQNFIEDTALKLNAEGAIQLDVQPYSKAEGEEQKWHFAEKKICVIFGYNYNNDEFVNEALSLFSREYGLAEDGGLVLPLVYPKDFLHSGRARISSLKDLVSDYMLDGMIILGAPEATHRALGVIEDEFGGKKPYPVASFFPQDDMLGIESTCDLVFEKGGDISKDDMLSILMSSVEYLSSCAAPLERLSEIEHAKLLLGEKHTIKRYIDNDTGLVPENHFILE